MKEQTWRKLPALYCFLGRALSGSLPSLSSLPSSLTPKRGALSQCEKVGTRKALPVHVWWSQGHRTIQFSLFSAGLSVTLPLPPSSMENQGSWGKVSCNARVAAAPEKEVGLIQALWGPDLACKPHDTSALNGFNKP